ncbi:MAG: L,D-transpeptidase, partial [Verrucomicrobiota bacterium]
KTNSSAPFSVLVMNKSNSPSNRMTNGVPTILAQTNEVPSGVFVAQPVKNILEAQVALARRGISAGSIDGVIGSQTRAALRAFQQSERLPTTGELDASTKTKLVLSMPLYTELVVTTNDLARLHPVGTNWLSKSQQSRLDYETILELVAEKTCCHPNFIKQLNPVINWAKIVSGTALRVVNIEKLKPQSSAAFVRVRLADRTLEAFDSNTNLLAHFPCSIAQRVEKRPVGELRVGTIAPDPDYTFNPEVFPESAEARQLKTKLILPPGPNNPVGTVWIGLDKAGYGIHGTPKPEDVGRTESHGCFRLANWNAEYLLRLVTIGTPVLIEP